MSNKTSVGHSRVGFFGLLAIVFITLKLLAITEVAEWSWLWVLAPLWIPSALAIFLIALLFIAAAVFK